MSPRSDLTSSFARMGLDRSVMTTWYRPTFEVRRRPALQTKRPAPASPAPEVDVAVAEEEEERLDAPWRVILYNDEIHTFDEVISQLIKATGCGTSRAEKLAWEVHTNGKAAVFEGSFEECFQVQGVLREIQLVTEIEG